MIRLIVDFVPVPFWLSLCDNLSCRNSAKSEPLIGVSDLDASLRMFASSLQEAGWSASMAGQICAEHTKQAREMHEAHAAKLVQLYGSLPKH